MFVNPVKNKLKNLGITLGTWMQIPHPGIAEVLANSGFDWITMDCEHSESDLQSFTQIARALEGKKTLPFVRVRENDTLAIRQMLDMGAYGIFVPMIESKDDAKKAVAAAKFPPEGVRGFAYYRANNYGENFYDYVKNANDNIAVILMIETKKGIENIDEILTVNGVDAVFLGPYDLTGSYGIVGKTDHPIIKKAKKNVLDACKRNGISAGLHVVKPNDEGIKTAVHDGFNLLALGMDDVFLSEGAKHAYNKTKKVLDKNY